MSDSSALSILFQHKFIVALAVALIVSTYSWNAMPPADPADPNTSRGGVALRIFFVTFLSIYLLSFLLENFDKKSDRVVGSAPPAPAPSLRLALKQVDHGAPDF